MEWRNFEIDAMASPTSPYLHCSKSFCSLRTTSASMCATFCGRSCGFIGFIKTVRGCSQIRREGLDKMISISRRPISLALEHRVPKLCLRRGILPIRSASKYPKKTVLNRRNNSQPQSEPIVQSTCVIRDKHTFGATHSHRYFILTFPSTVKLDGKPLSSLDSTMYSQYLCTSA